VVATWYVVDQDGRDCGEYADEVEAAAHAAQLTVEARGRRDGVPAYRVVPAVRWRSAP
jgi:hypothetical protein